MIRSIVFVFACLLAAASHAAPFVGAAHATHRGADFFGGGATARCDGADPALLAAACADGASEATDAGASKPADGLDADAAEPDDGTRPASFCGGDRLTFTRWVLDRMEFPASCYEAGEVAHVQLGFTVGRNGRPKKVVPYASDVRFADRVLVAVAASPDWQPALREGRPREEIVSLVLRIRLVDTAPEGAEPRLRAEDHTVYLRADTMPTYRGGGPDRWLAELKERVRGEGRYIVGLAIERDGSVGETIVYDTGDTTYVAAIERIVTEMPRWTPAVLQGEPVRFSVMLPVELDRPGAAELAEVEEGTYSVPMVAPKFGGGGLPEFRRWLMRHIRYPERAMRYGIEGRVLVNFVVERDGRMDRIEIRESPHPDLAVAVWEALREAPRWEPAQIGGRTVRVKYTLPVLFSVPALPVQQQPDEDRRTWQLNRPKL